MEVLGMRWDGYCNCSNKNDHQESARVKTCFTVEQGIK